MSRHSHECRRCGASIRCSWAEGRNGCSRWNGDNDGCRNCVEHSAECREPDGYRCSRCY